MDKCELVKSLEDILQNAKTINIYLSEMDTENFEYARSLIKKGTCFFVIKENNSYKFYPSRFIGYINNSKIKHESSCYKDGRITNAAIYNILREKPLNNIFYENEYLKYCASLGIVTSKTGSYEVKRKYWTFVETGDI